MLENPITPSELQKHQKKEPKKTAQTTRLPDSTVQYCTVNRSSQYTRSYPSDSVKLFFFFLIAFAKDAQNEKCLMVVHVPRKYDTSITMGTVVD